MFCVQANSSSTSTSESKYKYIIFSQPNLVRSKLLRNSHKIYAINNNNRLRKEKGSVSCRYLCCQMIDRGSMEANHVFGNNRFVVVVVVAQLISDDTSDCAAN